MNTSESADEARVASLCDLAGILAPEDDFIHRLLHFVELAPHERVKQLGVIYPVETVAVTMFKQLPPGTVAVWRDTLESFRPVAEAAAAATRAAANMPTVITTAMEASGVLTVVKVSRSERTTSAGHVLSDTDAADADESAAARSFGDTAHPDHEWVCQAPHCDHALPCAAAGAPEITAAIGQKGEHDLRYARWCGMVCLTKWAADLAGRDPEALLSHH